MSASHAPASGRVRPTTQAALGLALGLAGVIGYFVVVFRLAAWLPSVRNDALPNWLLVATGLVLSIGAATCTTAGRRLVPGLLVGLNVVVAAAFATILYVVPVVPAADGPVAGVAAPDFALADESGKPVRLADFRGAPLLLVFYRGHW